MGCDWFPSDREVRLYKRLAIVVLVALLLAAFGLGYWVS